MTTYLFKVFFHRSIQASFLKNKYWIKIIYVFRCIFCLEVILINGQFFVVVV